MLAAPLGMHIPRANATTAPALREAFGDDAVLPDGRLRIDQQDAGKIMDLLKQLGFLAAGYANGWGLLPSTALQRFAESMGLSPSGVFDPQVLLALLQQAAGGQSRQGTSQAPQFGAPAPTGSVSARSAANPGVLGQRLAQSLSPGATGAPSTPSAPVTRTGTAPESQATTATPTAETGAASGAGHRERAADLLERFEGFAPKAYWDVNAWRIGYGTEFKGDQPRAVRQGDTTTREAARRQLVQHDLPRFETGVAQQVGSAWAGLSDRAKAALISVGYNYGSLPGRVVQAARTGDPQRIADSIRSLRHHDNGVNAHRRDGEAAYVLGRD